MAYFRVVPASGGYRAHFHGSNGELVWWTEVYPAYQTAIQAINFAKANAANAPLKS